MDKMQYKRKIELLAPARDANIAVEAIRCGADAVYMGAESHGARVAAGNKIEDISMVVKYAHKFNARVYVTLNTLVYDSEIEAVENLIWQLYEAGVDALIVQDMGVLRMNIPPIALHASTQCDTRDWPKACFLQNVGFSQIVVARELSLEQIKEISSHVTVPLEAFVHGALCVSYSGDCQASQVAMGRSANRGECAQMCRLPYTLTDERGNILMENKHLLSLRDMNRSLYLEQMMDAGVSSFKIEGRLKDVGYVKNVVAYYRKRIDEILALRGDCYVRSSVGRSEIGFEPKLEKSFNRGFTPYFLNGENTRIASIDTPKSRGERVAVVKKCFGKEIEVVADVLLSNGDGMGYFDESGQFAGFRLNKVVGNRLSVISPLKLKPGTVLYRNKDKHWDDQINTEVSRTIDVAMSLFAVDGGMELMAKDSRGNVATKMLKTELQMAQTPQIDSRERVLRKTGGTIYNVTGISDSLGNVFVPASKLTSLRREVLMLLDEQQEKNYHRDMRDKENINEPLPAREHLTYHDNVSNRLAKEFYYSHGAKSIEDAIEISCPRKEITVMTTRYCLRCEMGRCHKGMNGKDWPSRLFINSGNNRFRLDFDCQHCQMKVVYVKDKKGDDKKVENGK